MFPPDQPLFALGPFTSGAMLLWGLAAAVPIILHFLNQRRRRTVAFAAMQFLLAAKQHQSRRMRLWQWLLLLARVAAVLLIAAALADPILGDRRQGPVADDAPTLHLLVLDASYSMRAVHDAGGPSHWDQAVQAAIDRVDQAAAGDAFCVVQMADPVVPVIVRPVRDGQAVRRELRRMRPTESAASLPATLAVVQQLIDDARPATTGPSGTQGPMGHQGSMGRPQVVIFSDMQRGTWTSLAQPTGRQAWETLAADAEIKVVRVGTAAPPGFNVTLADPRITSGMVAAGQTVDVQTQVRTSGGGAEAAPDALVQLKVAGQVRASAPLRPPRDGARAVVTLNARLSAGETALELETGADALNVDNRQWVPLVVPETVRVVCVGADRSTRYLAAAVAPRRDGPIRVQTIPADEIDTLDESPIDVLMLCDLRQPSPQVIALADRAAQAGAGVVWWLGANVDPDAYRRAAQSDAIQSLPILPAAAADQGLYAVDPRTYRHPIVAPFQPHPQSGLLSTPIFRYWRMTSADDLPAGCEVALAAGEQGDPLLLTCQTANSRIAIFTTAPSVAGDASASDGSASIDASPWNALVAWPSYVPLVQETLRWVMAPRWHRPSSIVGRPLTGTVPASAGRPTQLVLPDGTEQTATALPAEGNGWRWSAGVAQQAGAYWLQTDRGHRRVLAVNVDPGEGDLSRFEGPVPDAQQADRGSAGAGADINPLDSRGPGDPWFRILLTAAVGLLVIESLIGRVMLGWGS